MHWRFWRRKNSEAAFEKALCDVRTWEAEMDRAGFMMWMYRPPTFQYPVVEVMRRKWPTIAVWRIADIAPDTNIADLWWRPARGEVLAGDSIIELRKTPIGYV